MPALSDPIKSPCCHPHASAPQHPSLLCLLWGRASPGLWHCLWAKADSFALKDNGFPKTSWFFPLAARSRESTFPWWDRGRAFYPTPHPPGGEDCQKALRTAAGSFSSAGGQPSPVCLCLLEAAAVLSLRTVFGQSPAATSPVATATSRSVTRPSWRSRYL